MKWIPTSERLPDVSGDYLVTYDSGIVDISGFYQETKTFDYFISSNCIPCLNVIAWMPLPEPYIDTRR